MKKKIWIIIFAIILVLVLLGIGLTYFYPNKDIGQQKASNELELYITQNVGKDAFVIKQSNQIIIDGKKAYTFELCFSDKYPQLSGQIINLMAVSSDGKKIYAHQFAQDKWELRKEQE